MDAAARAELSALRRRAYGPDADLFSDPTDLARLVELEDLVRAAADPEADDAAAAAADTPTAESPAPTVYRPTELERPAPPDAEPAPPRRRSTLRGTVIAAVTAGVAIVIAIVLASPRGGQSPAAAPTPSDSSTGYVYGGDPEAQTLMTFYLDGSFAPYVDWPVGGGGRPAFPEATKLRWATDVGTYYGWHLWVAGGDVGTDPQYCILIERAVDVRTRCVSATDQARGRLSVALTSADIDPGDRPGNMSASESVGFWWLDKGKVEVVLGTFASG